jgi:hypothetical protein
LAPAAARTRVFLGVGVWPYYAYPPPYYYPPPVYYGPPVVYYAPPPVTYAPLPQPPSAPAQYCRQYRGDATNDQTGQPFFGTACLWPDGRWHIVN